MNELSKSFLRKKWELLLIAGALVLLAYYINIQIAVLANAPQMVLFPDTEGYAQVAKAPLLSREFLAGSRPLTLPLIYKIFQSDLIKIGQFQWLFSAFSWSILAIFVYRAIHNKWLKLPALALILVFSLSDEIILWHQTALSDSVRLSLFALLIACWLWLLEKFSWYKTAFLLLITFLWIFVREENALLAVVISAFLVIASFRNWRYLVIAIFLILFYRVDTLSSNLGGRWKPVVINIIEDRILVSEHWDIFAHSGMPATPEYLEYGIPNDFEFNPIRYDPQFLDWLDQNGKKIYIHYLKTVDPLARIEEAFEALPVMVSSSMLRYSPGYTSLLPEKIAELVFPRKYPLVIILASAFGCGLALLWVRKLVIPFGLLALIFPLAFIIFHGDSNEIGRHGVIIAVQARLGLWLLLFFGADQAVAYLNLQKDHIQGYVQENILEKIRSAWCFLNDRSAVIGPALIIMGIGAATLSISADLFGPSRSISFAEIGYAQGAGFFLGLVVIGIGLRLTRLR